jgi:hypothetical protein
VGGPQKEYVCLDLVLGASRKLQWRSSRIQSNNSGNLAQYEATQIGTKINETQVCTERWCYVDR